MNTESITQFLTAISIFERDSFPGHGGKILFKTDLVLVAAHEYNFEFLSSSNSVEISLAEKGSKSTARRTPMSTISYT